MLHKKRKQRKQAKAQRDSKILIGLLTLFIFSTSISISQVSPDSAKINPTGTYTLVTGDKDKNHGGIINIKLLYKSRIAIALEIGMGGLAESNGGLRDTTRFKNNHAIIKTQFDSTCTITFKFTAKGIWVKQEAADPNFACGFGHGVYADGYYRKVSSKKPNDKDLQYH